METPAPKITIHMVASLDGFIAKPDGNVSWMQPKDQYEKGETLTVEKIEAFLQSVDCYVLGSYTYEHALELGWPYGEKPVIVLTSRQLSAKHKTVEFYSGDLNQLVRQKLQPKYRNVWMVGGAHCTKAFLQAQLADEIVITIMPILLGEGTLFFDFIGQEQPLHLKDVTAYDNGMVELTYQVLKE